MALEARNQPAGLEQRISVLPKSEQHQEIDSEFYHGGCVYHDDASVDPMKLLLGLLDRARRAGAAVLDTCAAQAMRRTRDGFEVLTSRGT
jgi:glycine/D-amino acid oxidase-like deaminating enzyme